MDLIHKICQEPYIKSLNLTHKSSLYLLQLVHDLQAGEAFLTTLQNKAAKRIQIILHEQDGLCEVWKSIKAAYDGRGISVQVKTLQLKYDLIVKNRVFSENDSVYSIGLAGNEMIQFKRKNVRKVKNGLD